MLLAGSSAPLVVHDSALLQNVDVSQVQNAVPRPHYGPLKTSPYRLAGVFYQPMKSAAGFQQEGIASWYGARFHGRKTANGEVYNMYAMTAAHKTLPLPSYVRVTNKANGRSVVVRVNDRGPFHGNRVIDLSYVAARKLGFHNRGTTRVVIEAIDTARSAPRNQPVQRVARARTTGKTNKASALLSMYLQVAAFSTRTAANALKQRLQQALNRPVRVTRMKNVADTPYRVIVGPLPDRGDALRVGDLLAKVSPGSGYLVFE